MSSPAQGGPAVRKKRLSRVLTRVKTVFKKTDGKRSDEAEPSPAAGVVAGPAVAAPAPTPAPAPASAPAPVEAEVSTRYMRDISSRILECPLPPSFFSDYLFLRLLQVEKLHPLILETFVSLGASMDSSLTVPTSAPPAGTPKNNTMAPELPEGVIKVPRSQIYEERARKLSERYGLEITPSGWHHAEGHVLRVEKPIRMRIHRTCHKCGDYFGQTKECPNCKHVRCKECGRRPPKRSESERAESRKRRAALEKERAENPPIIADWDQDGKDEVLRRPSNKPGGQDLVLKRIRQRVRRTCCQCSRMFNSGEKNCPECKHIRCTDCPREP